MFSGIARRVFGTANERFLKRLHRTVDAINGLEPQLEALSDDALRERTPWLKERLANGEDLDSLMVDAFANVKIEVITASREMAEQIAEKVAAQYFENYSGVTYLEEVEILRVHKF